MFNTKKTYFVAWVAQDKTELGYCTHYGNHLVKSECKGNTLFTCIINTVHQDRPDAIITSITKLD